MPPKKKIAKDTTPSKQTIKKASDAKKISKKVSVVGKKEAAKSDVLEEEEFVKPMEEKKTSPYMSIYEYTALIRARALQLGTPGAEPKIELNPGNPEEYDPINIATREVRECLITLIIRRTLTDGTTEDWYPKDMIFPRM